jgi:uncharacterized membrane protein YesL
MQLFSWQIFGLGIVIGAYLFAIIFCWMLTRLSKKVEKELDEVLSNE